MNVNQSSKISSQMGRLLLASLRIMKFSKENMWRACIAYPEKSGEKRM